MTQLGSPPIQERARHPEEVPKSKRKFNPRILIPIALLIIGGGLGVRSLLNSRAENDTGTIRLSGRIEGYETNVGAKTAGRVDYVAVREGDQVRKGQVIVRLDDAEIQAQLRGASAQVAAAQQRERQTSLGINVLESQILEGQLTQQQSQGDAQGRIYEAEANIAQNEAQLAQAEAEVTQAASELKLASVDRDRYRQLVEQGAVNRQEFDQAQSTFETASAILGAREAAVNAARKQVTAAQGALVQAKATALNPSIRNAEVNTLRAQLNQTRAEMQASKSDVANLIAAREQIRAQVAYLNVISPIDGVVTARSVEPGAVVTQGKTLLTVINPNTVYMRGYIPQGNIGKVRVGQRSRVFLDSAPTQPLGARVTAIDTQASFTPENVYFRDDRVKQVFGVKLAIDNPGGFAKPGMPADAEVVIQPESGK